MLRRGRHPLRVVALRFSEVQATVFLGADALPGDGVDAKDRADLVEDARDRLIQGLALRLHEGASDAPR